MSNDTKKKKKHPILEHLDDVLKQSQNNIIFFGTVGSGKTTLLNKICNKNFKTVNSICDSCTRDIQYAFSIIHNMVIIDFPGLKSSENIINHLIIQKTAIQNIPIKMICFIIEIFDRFGNINNEISDMLKIFKDYRNNITIIITKTDKKKDFDDKWKKKIINDIEKRFNLKNIIFTAKNSNGYAICHELNEFQKKMENIKSASVKISSFEKNINFYNAEIEQKKENYENKFNIILNDHSIELNKHNESDLKLAIYFCFKSCKSKLLENYGKEIENVNFQETIDNDDENEEDEDEDERELEQKSVALMQFDGAIRNKFEDFRKNIEKILEVKISNYNNEFNKFKKCNYCGQIWFKIIGCDNMTCGQRTTIQDKIQGKWKNYTVSYDMETRKFTINSTIHEEKKAEGDKEIKGLTEEEKALNPKRKLEGKAEIKPIGCGNQLNWKEMEDCTESVLEFLKKEPLKDEYYTDSLDYYDRMRNNK